MRNRNYPGWKKKEYSFHKIWKWDPVCANCTYQLDYLYLIFLPRFLYKITLHYMFTKWWPPSPLPTLLYNRLAWLKSNSQAKPLVLKIINKEECWKIHANARVVLLLVLTDSGGSWLSNGFFFFLIFTLTLLLSYHTSVSLRNH